MGCLQTFHCPVTESPSKLPGTWCVYCIVPLRLCRAQIGCSLGGACEKPWETIHPFRFTEKVCRLPYTLSHCGFCHELTSLELTLDQISCRYSKYVSNMLWSWRMLTWVVRMSWYTPSCSYTFPLVGFSMQLLITYMPGSLNADGGSTI